MIALFLTACMHQKPPPTFPGPSGRSCENHRVVWVDPAPWTPIDTVALQVGERTARARPARPIAVLTDEDVTLGFGLSLQGNSGPATCEVVPTHPEAERFECGPYSLTLHYDALCAYAPSNHPFDQAGRPRADGGDPNDPLTPLLLDDALLVDTRKRCTIDTRSFLEIELAHLQERPLHDGTRHQTCGGRTPTDDVVDTLLTVTDNRLDQLPPGAPFYGPRAAEPSPSRGDGPKRSAPRPQTEFPWFVGD